MAVLRAACYSRVSTSEQAKYGYSIAAQVAILNQHCTENNIKIVDHYTDEGVSAGKPYTKRPEMLRLLEDVKDGKIDIILFTKLDRWFRSVRPDMVSYYSQTYRRFNTVKRRIAPESAVWQLPRAYFVQDMSACTHNIVSAPWRFR